MHISARNTTFVLNLTSCHKTTPEIIESLLYPEVLDENDLHEGFCLWQEVALYEGIEYLHARLSEYQLPFNIGDKTRLAISKILEDYSVSQLFNFLWFVVKNAAAFKQKSGISSRHAVNTIPGSIIKRHEYAQAQQWDIKGYSRDYNYSESAISSLLNNRYLAIGAAGFNQCISMEFLRQNHLARESEIIYDTDES